MKYIINEREVEIISTFMEDGCVFVEEAYYEDTGEMLNDDEKQELEEGYAQELFEDKYSSMVDAAHDSMDMER